MTVTCDLCGERMEHTACSLAPAALPGYKGGVICRPCHAEWCSHLTVTWESFVKGKLKDYRPPGARV